MSILDRLSAVPGTYWGDGNGPHSGPFVARITVSAGRSGSIALDYEAWTPGAGLQHAERALIHRGENDRVLLESTLEGQDQPLAFQEGQPGVFGSLDGQQVGVVIDVRDGVLSWAWWWAANGEQLKEQSRAVVRRLLEPAGGGDDADAPGGGRRSAGREPQVVEVPVERIVEVQVPYEVRVEVPVEVEKIVEVERRVEVPVERTVEVEKRVEVPVEKRVEVPVPYEVKVTAPARDVPVTAPWPGILVLTGMGGVAALARDLAKEVPSAAIVRGDLLARAIIGTEIGVDSDAGAGMQWRARLAARLSREYAELGHAVILAELESSGDSAESLLLELDEAGVGPVRLLVVDETTVARDVLEELPRRGRRRTF